MIRYKSPGAAAEAISKFNNRWFGGRLVKCEYWDGKTEYRWAHARRRQWWRPVRAASARTPTAHPCCTPPCALRASGSPPVPHPHPTPPNRVPLSKCRKPRESREAEQKRIDEFGEWLER